MPDPQTVKRTYVYESPKGGTKTHTKTWVKTGKNREHRCSGCGKTGHNVLRCGEA